jgi:phosphohistidine phosphatase
MKTLYLIRHAKSYWGDSSLSDFDRPLNKRGERDAPFMGKILFDKKVNTDLIISSPAMRAKKTAMEIADKLGYSQKKILFDENLYEASSQDILELIRNVSEKYNSIIIFGHNPGLTMFNNSVSEVYIDNIPTCGVVVLQFEHNWSEINSVRCKQLFFDYPKRYLKK